jgi:hypothetical protein
VEHERNRVDAEAGHSEPEPIADDAVYLVPDEGIPRVQVGLEVVEAVEVPRPRVFRVGPRRALHAGEDDTRARVGRALLGPDVPVAVRGVLGPARVEEPGMAIRRVVDDEIEQHADTAPVRLVQELDEVAARPEPPVDAVVVDDVVAVVAVRCRL